MPNVLVTMPFDEGLLDQLRAVSPGLVVTRGDPATADYAAADVLYAGNPPGISRVPRGSPGRSCAWRG